MEARELMRWKSVVIFFAVRSVSVAAVVGTMTFSLVRRFSLFSLTCFVCVWVSFSLVWETSSDGRGRIIRWYGGPVQVMEDNCTMRPCATDFSIAAIMSRHGRARTRCRERDPPDPILPLGKDNVIRLEGAHNILKMNPGYLSWYIQIL